MSRGAPSRALICPAVRRTASAMAGMPASSIRVSGPETLMLATTVGDTAQVRFELSGICGSSSPESGAYPRSRTCARWRLSSPVSVIVWPVLASSRACG